MNILRMIKSLFKRKSNSNTDITVNSDYIRKYDKLTTKEKIKVAKEIEKIVNFDFSDIITYTNNEDDKLNYIQDYLINAKRKPDVVSEDSLVNNARKINSLLIYAGECEIIKKELQEIKAELEIKYHALDSIITKPSSMLKKKKETLWFIKLRNNLIEARRKISVAIATVDFAILSSDNLIASSSINIQKEIQYQNYTINNELYQKTLDVLADTIHDYFGISHDFLVLTKELLTKIQEFLEKNTKTKSEVMSHYEDCFFTDQFHPKQNTLSAYLLYEQCNKEAWQYLLNKLPDNIIKELYKILAKYIHKVNIKAYDHRNDYKIYLKEVEDLTNKCLNTPTADWYSNGIYTYSSMLKFSDDGCGYSDICEAYLTDEIRQQMRTAFARLNWLVTIKGGFNGPYMCDSRHYLREDDAHILEEETPKYYNQFSEELLKKVEEKFDVNLSELKFLTKQVNYRVEFSLYRRALVDLLNDSYDKRLYANPTKRCPIIYRHKNTYAAITDLYGSNNLLVTIEDLYYYLRAKDGVNPEIDFSEMAPFNSHMDPWGDSATEINNFVALIQFKQFEKQYDDRILIIPDILKNDKLWDHIKFHRTNSIAVLATNYDMFDEFICSSGIRSTTKYLFVKDSTVISYRNAIEECFPIYYDFVEQLNNKKHIPVNGKTLAAIKRVNIWNNYFDHHDKYIDYPNLKIIIVPDDTSYSELSDILDQELAKTEEAKRNTYTAE